MQDLSLVANELLDSRLLSKVGRLIFMHDFFKAFDCVSWGFLDNIFRQFGFGTKMRNCIQTWLKMASFSILLNDSLRETFISSRGLCQGDPLSPMIFILAAEILTMMFLKEQDVGIISGFKVSAVGSGMPILQFADDTLILVNDDILQARVVRNISV